MVQQWSSAHVHSGTQANEAAAIKKIAGSSVIKECSSPKVTQVISVYNPWVFKLLQPTWGNSKYNTTKKEESYKYLVNNFSIYYNAPNIQLPLLPAVKMFVETLQVRGVCSDSSVHQGQRPGSFKKCVFFFFSYSMRYLEVS
jgi:hypothetical protein